MRLKASSSLIYTLAGLISLLVSYFVYLRTDLINLDGMCYTTAASAMNQGLHFASHLCPQASWPFYSMLIYGFSKLTLLDTVTSAYLLNSLFSLLTVITFIAIINLFTHQKRILVLAAFVILTANTFNHAKIDIIRDHGYWAFYLLSILSLLYFFRRYEWRYALAWFLSLTIATLFRIEGEFFILTIPFIAFLDTRIQWKQRFNPFLKLSSGVLVTHCIVIALLLIHPVIDMTRVNGFTYDVVHGLSDIWNNIISRSDLLPRYILNSETLAERRGLYLILLGGMFFLDLIKTITLVGFALFLYGVWKKTWTSSTIFSRVIWGYIIVNTLFLLAFEFHYLFLQNRYMFGLVLLLMLWIPFALDFIMQKSTQRLWVVPAIFLLIVASSLNGIMHFGYKQIYVRKAGEWLYANLPSDAKIFSNDLQVLFYAHRIHQYYDHLNDYLTNQTDIVAVRNQPLKMIETGDWKNYDYLAIGIDKHDYQATKDIVNSLPIKPVMVFADKRGDEIRVYKIIH